MLKLNFILSNGLKFLIILLSIFLFTSPLYAFKASNNNCKVEFQKDIYLQGLSFDKSKITIDKNKYGSYSWSGKCKNGYANGNGTIKVSILGEGIYYTVEGNVDEGYFKGKVTGFVSKSPPGDFIRRGSSIDVWVYKQKLFQNENSFYTYIKENDRQYTKEIDDIKEKQKLKKEEEEKIENSKKEVENSKSFLEKHGFNILFVVFILFCISLGTNNSNSNSDYSSNDEGGFSRSEARAYEKSERKKKERY